MKTKKKLSIRAVLINLFIAVFLFAVLTTVFSNGVAFGISAIIFALGFIPKKTGVVAMEGLQTEVWVDQLIDKLYPMHSFIQDGVDWTEHVDKNKINFAIAGGDPDVVVDRTRAQRPIPVTYLDDLPGEISLQDFSSNTTVVVDAETKELSYNKMETDINKHRNAIYQKYAFKGMHDISAVTETDHTLILEATGFDTFSQEACYIDDDLSNLAGQWDDRDYPEEGRVFCLSAHELRKMSRNSDTLKKQVGYHNLIGDLSGLIFNVAGFQIKVQKTNALYRKNGGGIYEKQPFGASETNADVRCGVAYIKKMSFAYADGTVTMWDEKSVGYQGWLMNFTKRGIVRPFQQKYLSSIVLPKA